MKEKKQKKSAVFRFVKACVKFFYKKPTLEGVYNIPSEPSLIIGNHAQMNGPIVSELYVPKPRFTWCIAEMMHTKEVPEYAFNDFWAEKPKYIRWFYKALSHIIAPLSSCIFTNADTIGVYKDARVISTFKETVEKLCGGADIVIFPEHDEPYSNIVNDFQTRFVDVARMYYRKTKKALSFVPMYVCPALDKLIFGTPVRFDPKADISEERERICTYLKEQITSIAQGLPEHRVVPYSNMPKKLYPKNK